MHDLKYTHIYIIVFVVFNPQFLLVNYNAFCKVILIHGGFGIQGILTSLGIGRPKRHSLTILNDINGVIKPGR